MTRARIAAAKAARVAGEEMRLLRRDAGALRIGDAAIDRQRGALATRRDLDRALGIDVPRMEKVEVARGSLAECQVLLVGQARSRVLGGEAGDVVGRLHRLPQRRAREVRRARVAATLPEID